MKENYKIYDENYDKHADRTSLDRLSSEYKKMLDDFIKNHSTNLVLDIGCGVGRDIDYMAQKSKSTTCIGLDASKNMVSEAKKKSDINNTDYIIGDMHNLPFKSNTFSGIWCQATIFMTDKQGMITVLENIKRILNANGTCIVSFKVSDSVSSENGRQIRERWNEKIEYYFTNKTMSKNIVQDSGFNISNIKRSCFGDSKFINLYLKI